MTPPAKNEVCILNFFFVYLKVRVHGTMLKVNDIKCLYDLYNFIEMRVISFALFPDFFGTYNCQSHTHSLPSLEAIRIQRGFR